MVLCSRSSSQMCGNIYVTRGLSGGVAGFYERDRGPSRTRVQSHQPTADALPAAVAAAATAATLPPPPAAAMKVTCRDGDAQCYNA